MRTLEKPNIKHKQVLESCISNIRDLDLKKRIEDELNYFELSSQLYEQKGNSGKFSEIPIEDTVNGNITKAEMKFLYNKKLVALGQPGRKFYDIILHSSKMCPICGYRLSKTLDHYLPKSEYPAYAVNPLNLIPCCTDCNFNKKQAIPTREAETLHPYYDRVDVDRWLYAEIIQEKEIGFKFVTKKPSRWTSDKFYKVNYHFIAFELSELYSIYASQELNDQAFYLKRLFDLSGKEAVREQLIEYHKSAEKNRLNHWKSAMYEALGNSDWFCSTGVQDFPI